MASATLMTVFHFWLSPHGPVRLAFAYGFCEHLKSGLPNFHRLGSSVEFDKGLTMGLTCTKTPDGAGTRSRLDIQRVI